MWRGHCCSLIALQVHLCNNFRDKECFLSLVNYVNIKAFFILRYLFSLVVNELIFPYKIIVLLVHLRNAYSLLV